MKELLDNAVFSMELGVEDYQTSDERRVLSAISDDHHPANWTSDSLSCRIA
ncbi:hypothetical protein SAMN03080618_01918 [Aquamicrobium aerolatum DSM 21857]|uniref:Uncharacterized protein n=1 Tax=Aquamicrobium aerolatum DSM 21857 TaxID=1121003 RepID=A0A1I3N236_9HYPH|nr:hypothetical protein SAMN03080618_01918 [Aquamicrobium aerolatum DSM 21857]